MEQHEMNESTVLRTVPKQEKGENSSQKPD